MLTKRAQIIQLVVGSVCCSRLGIDVKTVCVGLNGLGKLVFALFKTGVDGTDQNILPLYISSATACLLSALGHSKSAMCLDAAVAVGMVHDEALEQSDVLGCIEHMLMSLGIYSIMFEERYALSATTAFVVSLYVHVLEKYGRINRCNKTWLFKLAWAHAIVFFIWLALHPQDSRASLTMALGILALCVQYIQAQLPCAVCYAAVAIGTAACSSANVCVVTCFCIFMFGIANLSEKGCSDDVQQVGECCRYCHQIEPVEDLRFNICSCRQPVHGECLKRWISVGGFRDTCEICNNPFREYTVHKSYKDLKLCAQISLACISHLGSLSNWSTAASILSCIACSTLANTKDYKMCVVQALSLALYPQIALLIIGVYVGTELRIY